MLLQHGAHTRAHGQFAQRRQDDVGRCGGQEVAHGPCVAVDRRGQCAGVEPHGRQRLAELQRRGKHLVVARRVGRLLEAEVEATRRQPAAVQPGKEPPVHAQHQLVQEVQRRARHALHPQAEARERPFAQQHHLEVVLQQAEGAGHAPQRHFERGGAHRGAGHEREAAAAQAARQEAQGLVVQPLHQQREQRHVLLGRDARAWRVEQGGGDAGVLQRGVDAGRRVVAARAHAREHALDEHDRDGDGRLQHA
ncbi:hypothetical protein FQZ97_818490 [compost metagenome]